MSDLTALTVEELAETLKEVIDDVDCTGMDCAGCDAGRALAELVRRAAALEAADKTINRLSRQQERAIAAEAELSAFKEAHTEMEQFADLRLMRADVAEARERAQNAERERAQTMREYAILVRQRNEAQANRMDAEARLATLKAALGKIVNAVHVQEAELIATAALAALQEETP